MIGRWLARSSTRREQAVIITKAGSEIAPGRKGLSRRHILQAADDSLRRLQTDRIDVYLAHWPDQGTPIEETLRAFETLLEQGKVRAIGGSNYDAPGLREALDAAGYEGRLRELCMAEGLGVITYYSLASGFLAWLIARPGVAAPIASATSLEQLESLVRATRLPLAVADIELLDSASA